MSARKPRKSRPPREPEAKVLESSAVTLAASRLSSRDAGDLRWLLLEDFIGDLGVKSNFGDMIDRLANAIAGVPDPDSWHVLVCKETFSRQPIAMDERMLLAAERLETVLWRWRGLSEEYRATLRVLFGEAHGRSVEWAELWPLVQVSPVAITAFARVRDPKGLVSWLARLPNLQGAASRKVASDIRCDVDRRILAASQAWAATWRGKRERGVMFDRSRRAA